MMIKKREFLLLGKTLETNLPENRLKDYLVSEKLDGMRAFWDGGSTIGRDSSDVPWSTEKGTQSTGLWSRYGKVIHCPREWSINLPSYFLDGELWTGRGQSQTIMSICRSHAAGPDRWTKVQYKVFDAPPPRMIMSPGRINNNIVKDFIFNDNFVAEKWNPYTLVVSRTPFYSVYSKLQDAMFPHGPASAVLNTTVTTQLELDQMLETVKNNKGEGLMLRRADSYWTPSRTDDLLKIKPVIYATGVVMGFVAGKKRLEGMMGSATVLWEGKTFNVSGFTDAERGGEIRINKEIKFKYRELTDGGIPKEARYAR